MDHVKELLEHGVDVVNKTIHMYEDIDKDAFFQVTAGLAFIRNHVKKECDITIELSTYGGDLYYGFAIYDALMRWRGKVTIICCGPVMSAGTLVLQAGDRRVMLPNSDLMVHFGEQTTTDLATKVHYDYMFNKMQKLMASRSKVKLSSVKKWFTKESYFDKHKALEVGLVDEVLHHEEK